MLVSQVSTGLLLWTAASAPASSHQQKDLHRQKLRVARDSKESDDRPAGQLIKRGQQYTGIGSWYWPETGNKGSCGWFIHDGDWNVAIKESMYGWTGQVSHWCGQKITITANGRTARNVVIADACPGCHGAAGLDLTPGLADFFGARDLGLFDISWHLSSEDGQQNNDNQNKGDDGKKDEWKPPAPPSSKWEEPKWTPSSTKKQEWTPPSTVWTPSSTRSEAVSSTSIRSSTPQQSVVAPVSSAFNATSSQAANHTSSVVSAGASRNATSIGASGPASGGKSANDTSTAGSSGNLGRAAQIVLDLGKLVYAAAHKN